jgi:hypothetical protein
MGWDFLRVFARATMDARDNCALSLMMMITQFVSRFRSPKSAQGVEQRGRSDFASITAGSVLVLIP